MRRRKQWLILAAVGVTLALCVCAARYWLEPRSYRWVQVVSPDSKFRVSIPGTSSIAQTAEKTLDGRPFVSNMIKSTPARSVIYAVSWWENPTQKDRSTEELFAHFRECDINVLHGAVSEKNATVQGHPANYAFVLGANGLMVWNLTIRVGPRIYSLSVLDPSGFSEKDNIQKFFKSFALA
jgi:hypothetical protein